MINVNKLRGKMAEAGYNQTAMANALFMVPATFHRKMKRGVFDSDEISKMIVLLNIENPMEIFFADFGTSDVPAEKNED